MILHRPFAGAALELHLYYARTTLVLRWCYTELALPRSPPRRTPGVSEGLTSDKANCSTPPPSHLNVRFIPEKETCGCAAEVPVIETHGYYKVVASRVSKRRALGPNPHLEGPNQGELASAGAGSDESWHLGHTCGAEPRTHNCCQFRKRAFSKTPK